MLATTNYDLSHQWFNDLETNGREHFLLLYRRIKERLDRPKNWGSTVRNLPQRVLERTSSPYVDREREAKREGLSGRMKLDLLAGQVAEYPYPESALSPLIEEELLMHDMPLDARSAALAGHPASALTAVRNKRSSYILLLSLYEKSKREKEVLAERLESMDALHRELHHRTTNNFKQFERFIRAALGKGGADNRTALRDILSRVDSMAALHRQMYQGKEVDILDFNDYLLHMHRRLEELFDMDVEVHIDCSYRPDPATALQLGLIVNEMMTNSFKYAYPHSNEPICRIQCHQMKGRMVFSFSDNGGKMVETDKKEGFGSRLIRQLTDQLAGTHHLTNDRYGTTHHLMV